MKKIRKLRSSTSFVIGGSIVLLLVLFGAIVCALGQISFTYAMKKDYTQTTYHMAETAAALVDGDHIDDYLAGEETEEYQRTRAYLNAYCEKMSVSLLYVIAVDRSDYGSFRSVFNLVNNAVDDTDYTPWELGYERGTTNDDYRQKYRALYEQTTEYETVYRIRNADGSHDHVTTLVPVRSAADGEVTGLLCIQRPIRELREARRPFLFNIAVSTLLFSVLASLSAASFLRRHLVDPLQKVTNEASRFARENTRGESLGTISRLEELAVLGSSIDTMEADMVQYVENLTAATAEKQRIGTELELASTIQSNSIPTDFPAFPERTDFDIYASMDPAKAVGGDFYNFYLVDDDHLGLVIGDVSGKGIPAALFMMVTNILISDRAYIGSPAKILEEVNRMLCAHNRAEMFVTVWFGILELSTGTLTAANAGHEYPALARSGGAFELLRDKHGLVLGGMEGLKYRDYTITLAPGDKLFVYTDGVPEATDAQKQLFGTQRMLDALNLSPEAAPQKLLENVRAAVDGFVQEAEQFDDLTMLCLDYRGPGAAQPSADRGSGV